MKKSSWWAVLGYLVGLMLGCTTAAVVAQDESAKVATAVETPAAQVVGPAEAQKRYLPNGKAQAALYVTGANAFVGRLELVAGGAVPEHRDATEEYIYILEGSGTLSIDDVKYEVGPNTAVFMPAGAKVSYQNGDAPLVAVQVFAAPGPEAKYQKWAAEAPAPAEAPAEAPSEQ